MYMCACTIDFNIPNTLPNWLERHIGMYSRIDVFTVVVLSKIIFKKQTTFIILIYVYKIVEYLRIRYDV